MDERARYPSASDTGYHAARAQEIPIDSDLAPDDPAQPKDSARPRRAGRHRGRRRADVLAAISLGGALGGSARVGLGLLFPEPAGRFPWTTLAINVSGSFLLGAVFILLLERFGPSRLPRPFLATGFIGAFTTFSTMSVDTTVLIKDGHHLTAAAYLLATVAGGLVAVWGGMVTGRLVRHPVHHRT